MKLIILSEFDAVLSIEGKNYILDKKSNKIEIDFEDEKTFACFVYPTKEKLLPYAVNIVKNLDTLDLKSQHAKLLQIGENEFEVHLKKFEISSTSIKKVYSKDIFGFSLMIIESQTSLFVVKDADQINTFEIKQKFKNVAFDVFDNVPYFVANVEGGKFVCVYCLDSQKFFSYQAEKIEINEGKIEVIENLFSHAGHGKKTTLNLNGGAVRLENEELLYLNQTPNLASNIKVVPFAFFESIKLKDYNLAKSYLSPTLKNALNDEVLKEYFGDFKEITPYNFSALQGAFVSLLTEKKYKVFSFKFESGKISDISLIKEYLIK